MKEAINEPRAEVSDGAPKIVTVEIPLDKVGEVIGPKGKVINAIQQETGADVSVDDNGVVGTVTIGARDGAAAKEALRRIELILNPPRAVVGESYRGRVVNITKFGAFVNILPGRDGLVHISKLSRLAQGKRIERVEDVLSLGDELVVRVDDIDPTGKVSLSLKEAEAEHAASASSSGASSSEAGPSGAGYREVSFEDSWEEEARSTFGDLGPVPEPERGGFGSATGGARSAGSPGRGERDAEAARGDSRSAGPRRNRHRHH
jgi:polyribonucleotide nucleotidyltransferase